MVVVLAHIKSNLSYKQARQENSNDFLPTLIMCNHTSNL